MLGGTVDKCGGVANMVIHVMCILAGFFLTLGGILGFAGGNIKFNSFFVFIYTILFGILFVGLEFKWPPFLVGEIVFFTRFWGRAATYLFLGCILLPYGTGPGVCAGFVLAFAFTFLLFGILGFFSYCKDFIPHALPPPIMGLPEGSTVNSSVEMRGPPQKAPVTYNDPSSSPKREPPMASTNPPPGPPVPPAAPQYNTGANPYDGGNQQDAYGSEVP